MRKFLSLLMLLIFTLSVSAMPELREYAEFNIPQGTFIPVISLQEFSTAYCEEGDVVNFKTTNDIFMYETNVIPAGTKISGYIDKKNEPIVGTNAAMRVFLNKMVLSDGTELPIKGYIYTSNNNIIGGGLTPPAEYLKMPHFQRWVMFRAYSVTQAVPGATRRMGEHVTISAGADLIVVLSAPIIMTHTIHQ